jgi:hypothetical protein
MADFNYLNTGAHLGITGLLGAGFVYLIKQWMNDVKAALTKREAAEVDIKKDIASKQEKSVSEIKEKIAENKQYYTQTYGDIKCSIDKLAEHVATTNGRIGKQESAIQEVVTRCEERSKAFYREAGEERRKQ